MDTQTMPTDIVPTVKRPFRILTPEECEALGPDDSDEILLQAKRQAQREWRSARTGEFKRLALQLGVKRALAKVSKSGEQGEYVNGTPDYWYMSERSHWIIAYNPPAIMIDIEEASQNEGIPEVIAHEIGHHLDALANGYPKTRKPKQSFISAFKRAGFHEYADAMSDLFSELIAETLSQYLRGHKLNPVLLTEAKKVVAKLSRRHRQVIQAFRNRQRKQAQAKVKP
jgi:hypothetical protein